MVIFGRLTDNTITEFSRLLSRLLAFFYLGFYFNQLCVPCTLPYLCPSSSSPRWYYINLFLLLFLASTGTHESISGKMLLNSAKFHTFCLKNHENFRRNNRILKPNFIQKNSVTVSVTGTEIWPVNRGYGYTRLNPSLGVADPRLQK